MTSEDRPVEAWTVDELAEMLKLSREYVSKRAAARDWPHRRFGRRVVFFREDIEVIKTLGVAATTDALPVAMPGMRRRRGTRPRPGG